MVQTHRRRRVHGRRIESPRAARRGGSRSTTPLWLLEAIEPRVMLAVDGAFTGVYYNEVDLTNPAATQSDSRINFDWGKDAPAPGVDASTFSVRWTGKIKPAFNETYTFTATADDGARVWVNGNAVIDRWGDRGNLTGDVNADGTVDFADYQLLEGQFKTNNPQSDFNKDGVVNTADATLLLLNYGKTLATSTPASTGTITLLAGQEYDLRMEYYQNADQANAKLEWQSPSQAREVVPPAPAQTIPDPNNPGDPNIPGSGGSIIIGDGNGLLGTYFDNKDFTGTAVSRVDPTVSFRWNGFRPTSRIDTTTFSVRWEGKIQAPASGEYTFLLKHDDAIRLTVNGQMLYEFWGENQVEDIDPPVESDPITLVAGQRYDIKVEYFQNQGGALVDLGWRGPGVTEGIVPTGALFPASGATLPPPTELPPVTRATTPLRLATDGHFLIRQDGSPFFWMADTAWSLFNNSSRADVDYYLQDRSDKEFTVTQAVLYNPDAYRANAFGQPVFLNNNPATPNPAYFDHVDYTLDKAQQNGLYVAMLPTWGDAVASPTRAVFNTTNARAYGEWLGRRYAAQANIIWVLGGDWAADTDAERAVWRAMAEGLRTGDGGTHLITYHPIGGQSSTDSFPQTEAWLDFNTIQSGHTRDSANYDKIAADYGRSPAKPVVDFEPNYENIPNGLNPANEHLNDYDVRKKTYWALFAGAFGASYGNWEVYEFSNDTTGGKRPWREALNYPGATQMKYVKRLMESRPYLGRVPDQGLVVGGTLTGSDHIQATRGGDGSYAMIYSAGGRSFTVDLSRLSGTTIKASWFNPRTGAVTGAGQFAKSVGAQSFAPPSSGTGQDWVLVLDDASKNYGGAGQLPPPPPPESLPGVGDSFTGSVTDGSKAIPYRLFKPTGVPAGERVPLILYLHGRDERGTDNVRQTTWIRGLVGNTKSGPYAAYVLAPQIDPSMWFQSYNGSETQAMRLVIQAVRQVMSTENVDPSRVYVTGVSMGGMGAWDAIKWEPNLFAAAVPMSGYANPNTASTIKNVPIWAFHGSNDTIVNVSGTRNIINAIRAQGGNPKYTEVAGGGHVIWDPIFFDQSHTLYSWLFAQRKAGAAAAPGGLVTAKPAPRPATKPVVVARPVFSATKVAVAPQATVLAKQPSAVLGRATDSVLIK